MKFETEERENQAKELSLLFHSKLNITSFSGGGDRR
jgi:hypothetical protein